MSTTDAAVSGVGAHLCKEETAATKESTLLLSCRTQLLLSSTRHGFYKKSWLLWECQWPVWDSFQEKQDSKRKIPEEKSKYTNIVLTCVFIISFVILLLEEPPHTKQKKEFMGKKGLWVNIAMHGFLCKQ